MRYQAIEVEIRTRYTNSALDEWIVDCGNHIFTKIIAFNFFSELHFLSLSDNDLRDCIFMVEEHLQRTSRSIDPIDRIKNAINSNNTQMWNSHVSQLNTIEVLSRIIQIEKIDQAISAVKGDNNTRIPCSLNERGVQKVITEFNELLNSGKYLIPFPGGNNIIWLSPSQEILSKLPTPDGTAIRDLLGLYFRGSYLIEIQFSPDEDNIAHKPTIFHSGFGPAWKSVTNTDGWGITLDLQNLKNGIRESVRRASIWPPCSIIPHGFCRSDCRSYGWEDYFDKRIRDFTEWATNSPETITDLNYFLNKINYL